jgi:hypothetical protein
MLTKRDIMYVNFMLSTKTISVCSSGVNVISEKTDLTVIVLSLSINHLNEEHGWGIALYIISCNL